MNGIGLILNDLSVHPRSLLVTFEALYVEFRDGSTTRFQKRGCCADIERAFSDKSSMLLQCRRARLQPYQCGSLSC